MYSSLIIKTWYLVNYADWGASIIFLKAFGVHKGILKNKTAVLICDFTYTNKHFNSFDF